jgi:hypothetical protein
MRHVSFGFEHEQIQTIACRAGGATQAPDIQKA